MAKVALTLFVIAPVAKSESINLLGVSIGFVLEFTSGFFGYMLDGSEVKK